MNQNRGKPTKLSAFQEELLLMNGQQDLTSSEKDAINLVLANNSAVGVIAGTYDEGLPITFASYYFLRSLGYDYAEYRGYDATHEQSLTRIVHEEDRDLFEIEHFREVQGRYNFRILARDGGSFYANAYKAECEDADGNRQWILSIRVSVESIDLSLASAAERERSRAESEREAMTQLVQAMSALVVRFAICDLAEDSYTFYDCGNGAAYPVSGTFTSLREGMDRHLRQLLETLPISEVFSPENLRCRLKTPQDTIKFDYAERDDSRYYNMSVVPMEWQDGVLRRFVMLAQDITETKRVELQTQQALRDACAAANRASEAKTDFLSHMSHDIRTPMNAIIGMTALAGAHIDERDRVVDCLEKITGASRHLLSLINDLLDMSRIEKGDMTLAEEDMDLSELIDGMINMIKPEIARHHHNLEVTVSNVEHEQVIGDSLKIQQMFTNIMGNAIKYTPDGGHIRLSITERPTNHTHIGCYEFVVEDDGIGMSEEFQQVMFDPFARDRNKYVNNTEGSGLGMAITKNIVNLMDGDIQVESAPGKGSKFTVTIFLQLQEVDDDTDEELLNLPVLVVDDDAACCEATAETLQSIGMAGEWVTTGREAIERTVLRHERADDYFAIIMDWIMPEMDGIETAREIRRRVGRDVPIIMLSAYDYSEIESQARAAGVDCFISKPLFKSRLRSVFRTFVNDEQRASVTAAPLEEIRENDYSDRRILLVEDNDLNREIAVEIVGMTGVQIETAVDGKEALDMFTAAADGYYDMILMDIQMPVMNGYEATNAIRALPDGKGAGVPIVAMTANAFAEDVIRARTAGFNDHLAKPIDIGRLGEILREHLSP